MKKLFFGLIFWFSGFTAFSQDGNLAVGFVGSLDFYQFDFTSDLDPVFEFEAPLNYSLGLQANYAFSDDFSGNLSILGSRKGYEVTHKNSGTPTMPESPRLTYVRPYYLSMPVSMEYNYLNNPHLKLFVSAGLVPVLLVDDRESSVLVNNSEVSNTTYIPTNYNNFFMGATFSTGLKYMVNNTKSIRIEPYFRPYFSRVDKKFNEFEHQFIWHYDWYFSAFLMRNFVARIAYHVSGLKM